MPFVQVRGTVRKLAGLTCPRLVYLSLQLTSLMSPIRMELREEMHWSHICMYITAATRQTFPCRYTYAVLLCNQWADSLRRLSSLLSFREHTDVFCWLSSIQSNPFPLRG